MGESFEKERPKNFKDFIEIGRSYNSAEAIKILCDFHSKSSKNAVLSAFSKLKGFEGRVVFRNGINSGYDCIVMEGQDVSKNFVWNSLIDEFSGQPQVRCG